MDGRSSLIWLLRCWAKGAWHNLLTLAPLSSHLYLSEMHASPLLPLPPPHMTTSSPSWVPCVFQVGKLALSNSTAPPGHASSRGEGDGAAGKADGVDKDPIMLYKCARALQVSLSSPPPPMLSLPCQSLCPVPYIQLTTPWRLTTRMHPQVDKMQWEPAEVLYRRAIELFNSMPREELCRTFPDGSKCNGTNPGDEQSQPERHACGGCLTNYGIIMHYLRRNFTEAELLYRCVACTACAARGGQHSTHSCVLQSLHSARRSSSLTLPSHPCLFRAWCCLCLCPCLLPP